jgi:hypothetical protein
MLPLLAPVATSAASRHAGQLCPGLSGLTIAADRTAELYYTKAPPGEFNANPTPQQIPNYVGCATGHRPLIVGHWGGITVPALGGGYAAYTSYGGSEEQSIVHVVNLGTGQRTEYPSCSTPVPPLAGPARVGASLVINSSGDVAWICETAGPSSPSPYSQIRLTDRSGTRTLASGFGIDWSSLTLIAGHAYWIQNGQVMTATAS